ncbi:serine hydrolase domain-containing protein [Rhodobacter sp. NSM]|uniref:serine hydrolase domain-containing protein n=1 Tax=Rhodobacter sp. NSM TaxID=3457501 RepID=UPI003FD363F6
MTQPDHPHSCSIPYRGEDGLCCDPTLLFPYWSFTKTVLAICALKLAEGGRINLDEPLQREDFTLRQLLNHTAGLPDYGTLPDYHRAVESDEEPWPRDELLRAALAQGRLFAPGRGWSYSNVGYMLAREWIEKAAGCSFADLVRGTIVERLGLESVTLATTREHIARVHWEAARRYHPGWVYHGCLIGSARDAARLLHALIAGQVLNAASMQQMMARRRVAGAIAGRPWTECGYGLGLMSGSMGAAGHAIGHSGGGPFSANAIYHFPDLPVPTTVACFTAGPDQGRAEFAAVAGF